MRGHLCCSGLTADKHRRMRFYGRLCGPLLSFIVRLCRPPPAPERRAAPVARAEPVARDEARRYGDERAGPVRPAGEAV